MFMYICNTFTPKIKGIQRVTYLMSPWFEGNIFDAALLRGQHRDVARGVHIRQTTRAHVTNTKCNHMYIIQLTYLH